LNIHGFTKTTLLDYPGIVASTVFTAGCSFRCPFCHNGDLVLNPDKYPHISEEEILAHLKKRRNICRGVCISGGEPTLSPDLSDFMIKIKELDILIKLDTNGYQPDVLEKVIKNKLVDYVAMDIKAGHDNYSKAAGIPVDIKKISKSIDILSSSFIEHEFRTTCVKGIHSSGDFEDIAGWLPNTSRYYLQNFRLCDTVIDKSLDAFDKSELLVFLDIVKGRIPGALLRGID